MTFLRVLLELAKSPTVWIATFLWGGFWPIALAMDENNVFHLVNAVTVSIGIGICFAYFMGAIDSLRLHRSILQSGDYLVLGIVVTWFATAMRYLYNDYWRWMGQPDMLINSRVVAFLVWVLATGGILHLTVKGAIDGRIPTGTWIRIGWWVVLGLIVGFSLIHYYSPSIGYPDSGPDVLPQVIK